MPSDNIAVLVLHFILVKKSCVIIWCRPTDN